MRKKVLITILIGLMILGICSNSIRNILLLNRTNKQIASIEGLLVVNDMAFNLLGQFNTKLIRPNFNRLLESTVVIYNKNAIAGGVCIDNDKDYYYILTVAHIIDMKDKPTPLNVVPESNLGYAVNLEIINRFLRSTSNRVYFPIFNSVSIELYNHDTCIGEVIKKDSFYDLALIRIAKNKYNKLTSLSLSKIPVKTGDKVFICGHPLGIYFNITEGIISNLHDANFIVVDATMTFGNSGGGVYNQFGQLIGICSKVPVYFAVDLSEREE